ncbi:MAG TPA: hypothetical protein VF174_04915 [Micromonosporaceae bacterium]
MTATQFRVTMMLADHAQVADGKLFISGGGWSITITPTQPSALAVLLQVPWTEANRKIPFRLRLVDGDGQPVRQQVGNGQAAAVEVTGDVEVGRPAGAPHGIMLDAPIAAGIPPLFLSPGRYVWELWLDGETRSDWQVAFLARAAG